ncbi:hypothetical protein [Streptomyces sp. NBC_01614]|uniref:hypothetical protein n=1 Tax=Streptomyces sp. NBC_01614 TaxID=2975897 RepID=UPI003866E173
MNYLPEPPTASAAGQATNPLTDAVIEAAIDNAIEKAKKYETTPQAVIGNSPPVPQPGIPPQSNGAVDYAIRVLSTGVAGTLLSGGAALILAVSPAADPVVCGIVFGAPMGLAVPIAALSALAKNFKKAAPATHHHNYSGPVYQDQRNVENKNSGVWVKNTNQ